MDQVNCTVTIMSIPPTTSFAEAVSIGAITYVRTSSTCSFISSYLSLVHAPPDAIFLDVALLTTGPACWGFPLVGWCFTLAFVGVILGSGRCSRGSRGVGGGFIPTSEACSRVEDGQGVR